MRTILHVLPALDSGGVELSVLEQAEAIANEGWKPLVTSQGGRLVPKLEEYGATHIFLPLVPRNPLAIITNSFRLVNIIKQHKVDLIHTHSRAPAWSSYFATQKTRIPLVSTFRGAYNQRSWFKKQYNSSMVKADAIIAHSKYISDLIVSRYPYVYNKVKLIRYGIKLTDFESSKINDSRVETLRQSWNLPSDCRVLLNIARITRWKGQMNLIAAFSKIATKFPNIHLVIAGASQGRNNFMTELQNQIAHLKLKERIHLVGHCTDVPGAIKLADCVVAGAIEPEAFGRVAVETQAIGKPCVVTEIGAQPENILAPPEFPESKRTGWKIPPNDELALKDALISIFSLKPSELSKLADRAQKHAHLHYSLKVMTEKTLELYQELLK